jgi:uridine kinase
MEAEYIQARQSLTHLPETLVDPAASTIAVRVGTAPPRRVNKGTRVFELLPSTHSPQGLPYLAALVNHEVNSLSFPLEIDCSVEPIDMTDEHGLRIYRRSLAFLAAKVMNELFPQARFSVEHSLGNGVYCTFERNGGAGITAEELQAVERRLREWIEQDLPIVPHKLAFADAVKKLQQEAQYDKYNLLRFRNPPAIVVFSCGDFSDLAHGVIASRTGHLRHFEVIHYAPGFVIQFPDRDTAPAVAPFEKQPHLFTIFQEHKQWGRILGLTTVGQLNELIARDEVGDFVKIAEALHEKKIARIADEIQDHRDRIKMICIAGPSSAGKTTLAKRLRVQLRVNGLRPKTISVDDYFVDRDDTPRDDRGDYDFEHIEAIDLARLNEDLERLDHGEEIQLPHFNFESGKREHRDRGFRLEAGEILILEGIHCLNPRLTAAVPARHTFKIYISALGQLNLDRHNRISTTDNRLLRRLVRDHQFRGHAALTTLRMWPSVQRGERRWIFPNQHHADIAFNSALDYELAVLKPIAEPLLAEVKPTDPEYADARRLMDTLQYFLVIPNEFVPPGSILREYIGRSSFEY